MTSAEDQARSSTAKRANKSGRPRCSVSGTEVRKLLDEGLSWRQIARALNIGTATAMRLSRLDPVPNPSQNPGGTP
jgi:DNA-binding NarL/FixJ family response regulator